MGELSNITRRKAMQRATQIFGTAMCALALPARSFAAAEQVEFSWISSSDGLPFFVALEEKMFEAEGIKPISNKLGAPNLVIDSFVSGRSEVGPGAVASGISLIAEAQFPGTFRFFGFAGGQLKPTSIVNNGLVALNGSPIKSFADLKGRKLGIVPGIQWRTITRHILRKSGLDPDKDVQLVPIAPPTQTQAVISGNVDALLSFEPMISMAVATGNVKVVVDNPCQRFIGDPFWGGISLVTTKLLDRNPALVGKVIKVLNEATKLTQNDFDRYKPLLHKYAGLPEQALSFVRPVLYRSESQIDDNDIAGLQRFADILFEEGAMARKLDVKPLMIRLSDIK